MLESIINFSIRNKLIILLFTLSIVLFGFYSIYKIPVGAVPDITNNQVQIITTSANLSTQEIEQYITTPVEMEMANLPGVLEIRSISKFGISLVTVVFKEKLGTYLPRQLIAEKIKSAESLIPEQFGKPEMGPITTGLGEVYQYIVEVKPGYEDVYSAMDIRTIQDWIIKRRLSGINGVVEINSWGGYLKQYEVAIDPLRLKSMQISLSDVFTALEKNNGITGGSYIEKTNQSFFIRGDGQVKTLEDIETICIKNDQLKPVLIKDIATVKFGYANRFGAITANGKGETVLGQVMMLKNANSKQVIHDIKLRVAEIQKSLPVGIKINPILERSELISKTSFTVVENLILGALIVMLTVILILGNVRAALVIASMIPLALLFTVSMMYVFGIDANLMSLGALDFGIIIDGAVIIVEYIAIRVTSQSKEFLDIQDSEQRQSLLDKISYEGASKMMKSAIFGQVIIIIVFIPILSLGGVEGKMFRPMALAFSFAILGAMITGLTWLPVASSIFLKPGKNHENRVSAWIMDKIFKSYLPVIKWSCSHKRIVLGTAFFTLVLSLFLFTRMGGEFVPTLDEGDFVIQPVLKTGTSLSKTIEMTTKMENILIEKYPDEVEQIVSRIGAAEVPTDPMSMEEIDMIIKLKPKKNWKLAKSKEELAEKFKESLSIIPNVDYEFTQPIEMRFNELITGVRSDIAIKVFGNDMDYLNKKAIEIEKLIADIPGASDIILEKTAGLPQIKIQYNRKKIVYYGIDIETLNAYLSAAFGGRITGTVFEEEKRFDLVVRFNTQNRTDIDNIRNLTVPVTSGNMIPFSELAEIEYTQGPAKISRDNTQRRVVISVNVRNRDLQSVINDIQHKIDQNITLATGNYIAYGGQFENLQSAKKRLLLAIPIALLLIFIFLHFAFKSFKDAIMIFTAIPLSVVGGVFLLWARGLPFSVSAGVGFIALFGIAVLNGIVLIEHLKELHKYEFDSIQQLILKGTTDRLRPVLLTASAAAMGFLPMALSTNAGAEVQRPLATVVIGGLVTSTLLTMIALPLLFEIFYNVKAIRFFPLRFIRDKNLLILLFAILPAIGLAQNNAMDYQAVIDSALKNNPEIKAYTLKVEESKMLKKTSFSPDKTLITYGTDQNNIAENGFPLKVWGIEQNFSFPTQYVASAKIKNVGIDIALLELELKKTELLLQVTECFFACQMISKKITMYNRADSLYTILLNKAEKRAELGDISQLEVLNIKVKLEHNSVVLNALNFELENLYNKLKVLINTQEKYTVQNNPEILRYKMVNLDSLPEMRLLYLQCDYANTLLNYEKSKLLPDLTLNYFIGTNNFDNAKYYQGFQAGIALPLFFSHNNAGIKAAQISSNAQLLIAENESKLLVNKFNALFNEQKNYKLLIDNYENSGKQLHSEILRTAIKYFELGEIDFFQFVASFDAAFQYQIEYFDNLYKYNVCTAQMMYFTK